MVARCFYKLFRRLIYRIRTEGLSHLAHRGPLILVSNHNGSFGPICVITSLPVQLYPWVAHEVTNVETAAERIRGDFVEPELHLRPPLSRWVSRLIARVCVALMRDVGAIPVYDRSRKIRLTVDRSLRLLEQGRNILVFPENVAAPVNEVLGDFCTGFIHIAKLYYERTRKAITFLPIAVNKRVQAIRIGAPIRFDAASPFHVEKQRLKEELEGTIYRLYYDLERAADSEHLPRSGTA